MKKILWLIFLLIPILNVKAEVYYSDYRLSDKELELSDTVKVDKVKLYKWFEIAHGTEYSLYKGDGGYNCSEVISNWQTDKLEVNEARSEEIQNTYEYKLSKGVRYIHLTNLNGSYGAIRITELQVFIDNKEIKYTFECNGCHTGFEDYINNGIWLENKSYITNGGSIVLDLGKEYPANKVNVVMYLFDLGEDDKTYTISYSTNKKNLYINKNYIQTFSDIYWDNALKLEYSINDFNTNDWYTLVTSSDNQNKDYVINKTLKETKYRYTEKWCYYDFEEEAYFDYYTENAPTITSIRSDDYIEEDRYFIRDKIEIEDNIVIESEEDDINDFINSTTPYELEYDFDKTVNGTYNIKVKTPYKTIDKEVKVLNKDTIIKEQQKEIDDLKNKIKENESSYKKLENTIKNNNNSILQLQNNNKAYREKIDELLNNNNKLNADLKEVIAHEQELSDNYNNKLVACNNENTTLNKEVKLLKSETSNLNDKLQELTEKQNSTSMNYILKIKRQDLVDNWYLIILILLLLLLLIMGIMKNKSKDE